MVHIVHVAEAIRKMDRELRHRLRGGGHFMVYLPDAFPDGVVHACCQTVWRRFLAVTSQEPISLPSSITATS